MLKKILFFSRIFTLLMFFIGMFCCAIFAKHAIPIFMKDSQLTQQKIEIHEKEFSGESTTHNLNNIFFLKKKIDNNILITVDTKQSNISVNDDRILNKKKALANINCEIIPMKLFSDDDIKMLKKEKFGFIKQHFDMVYPGDSKGYVANITPFKNTTSNNVFYNSSQSFKLHLNGNEKYLLKIETSYSAGIENVSNCYNYFIIN